MAQPEFRRGITERMGRLPQPIPALWSLVDGLHYTADAGLTLLEEVHVRLHDQVVRLVGTRLGLPSDRVEAYLRRHGTTAGKIYGAARAAHWYL